MKNNELEMRLIFAKNLKKLMDEKQINNVELSKRLNLSESAVGKWLLGKSLPRMGMIEIIANYFGVNKTDLLEEKTEENKSNKKFEILARNFEKLSEKEQEKIFNIIEIMLDEEDDNNEDF